MYKRALCVHIHTLHWLSRQSDGGLIDFELTVVLAVTMVGAFGGGEKWRAGVVSPTLGCHPRNKK